MELLNSYTSLSDRDRKKILGKCLDLEDESIAKYNRSTYKTVHLPSSVAADEPFQDTGTYSKK